MSILIKGMEMPKEGFVEILIRDDGTVQQTGQSYRIDGTDYYTPYIGEMPVMYEAVPVPPHGGLTKRIVYRGDVYIAIEAERIKALDGVLIDRYKDGFHDGLKRALQILENDINDINDAPTVIPTDKDGET